MTRIYIWQKQLLMTQTAILSIIFFTVSVFFVLDNIPDTSCKEEIIPHKSPLQMETWMRMSHLSKRTIQRGFPSSGQNVSCNKIISGDNNELIKAEYLMSASLKSTLMDEMFPLKTRVCREYRHEAGYINKTMSKDEEDFPIAFSIIVYKHVEQVERLLRMLWRPNNIYCISIDAKSRLEFEEAVVSIAKCFDNVFVHPVQVDVLWGTFTVLEPDLLCMDLLWKQKKKWRYFINLTGQELPLKTNYELVQILRAYHGANDIQGTFREADMDRWEGAGVPPAGLIPRKGAVHIIASRGYVDYVLHNEVAISLLHWVKKVQVPDEAFFSMLNYNPHLQVPGSYTGDVDDGKRLFLGRYKLWFPGHTCSGRIARNICIMEVRDLQNLVQAPELFVNKFFYDHHPLAYDCLEEWYHNKVDMEEKGKLDFDTAFYKNRWITSHHV